MSSSPTELASLRFDNRFTAELAADPDDSVGIRQVYGAHYSRVLPTPVTAPRTVLWSPEVAADLGISPADCESTDFAEVFAGNRVPAGADPFAMTYGGHQFGVWADQLGDGRAIALGEVLDTTGRHQTLQLKGAGPTPYSRSADGRAVLRSSVREFLCSEAMHHLGIPTTRALSLVVTGERVVRDMMYDGNPRPEPGAVVCRVAPSFVRFGSFELPAARGEIEQLSALVEHVIRADFPHLVAEGQHPTDVVGEWFQEVCLRTAALVVDWTRVGFVHGVLNTDNMSIVGLTIDYGPYGWLESFDPNWTPNTTDGNRRRYAFGAQPQIVQWNLLQLANALVMLTEDPEPLEAGLTAYGHAYESGFRKMMSERLGWGAPKDKDRDEALSTELFQLLARAETDQVIFFRNLAKVSVDDAAVDDELLAPLTEAWYRPEDVSGDLRADWASWLRRWGARARAGGLPEVERVRIMNSRNPRFVLRNYLAQEAIDAAEAGDYTLIGELFDTLRMPYEDQPGRERFAAKRPEWARHRAGCSMLSCSS